MVQHFSFSCPILLNIKWRLMSIALNRALTCDWKTLCFALAWPWRLTDLRFDDVMFRPNVTLAVDWLAIWWLYASPQHDLGGWPTCDHLMTCVSPWYDLGGWLGVISRISRSVQFLFPLRYRSVSLHYVVPGVPVTRFADGSGWREETSLW